MKQRAFLVYTADAWLSCASRTLEKVFLDSGKAFDFAKSLLSQQKLDRTTFDFAVSFLAEQHQTQGLETNICIDTEEID